MEPLLGQHHRRQPQAELVADLHRFTFGHTVAAYLQTECLVTELFELQN